MEKGSKNLIVITGPTAVGKTHLTIDIATHYECEIISCDSRQFYKEMNIGTAKPTLAELSKVEHHFVNSLSISQNFTAGDFEREGLKLLDRIFKKQDIAILTGGSGLFIKALCEGFHDFPDVAPSVVHDLKDQLEEEGIQTLQEELRRLDPEYYHKVDIHNAHRIVRALSVIRSSGKTFSSFTNSHLEKRDFKVLYIILNRDRSELYERINLRVDQMMANGLLDEVISLLPFRDFNALQTIGYKELFDHLEGDQNLEDSISLIKQNSRRYAKRQLTWFRRIENAVWFHPDHKQDIIDCIDKFYGVA